MDTAALIAEAFEHYTLLPVGQDSKACLVRHWNTKEFTKSHLLSHARGGGNIAARVGLTRSGVQVLVIDRDARDLESWRFLREYGLCRSAMQTETASGNWHLWFRLTEARADLRSRIKFVVAGRKLPIDVKATGYVLLPGSRIDGREYRFRAGKGFRRPEELEPVSASFLELLREQTREPIGASAASVLAAAGAVGKRARRIVCPERYVLRIASVQGENGSAALVRCVTVLRDCGWDRDRILRFVRDVWNPACARPPWSESEIEYAVKRHVPGGER